MTSRFVLHMCNFLGLEPVFDTFVGALHSNFGTVFLFCFFKMRGLVLAAVLFFEKYRDKLTVGLGVIVLGRNQLLIIGTLVVDCSFRGF